MNVDAKWGNSQRGVPNYDVMTDPGMYMETAYKALYNSMAYNGKSSAEAFVRHGCHNEGLRVIPHIRET